MGIGAEWKADYGMIAKALSLYQKQQPYIYVQIPYYK